jgi:ribonuclease-3
MEQLEKNLRYTFKNRALLENALAHSSYANEKKGTITSNERLEFLGDSVLSIIVSEYIYSSFPNLPEGQLTRLRASLVCEKTLCGFSKQLDVGKYLLLGKGEKANKGNERPSILADAFEAILAAIYLDGGIVPAKQHVLRFVKEELSHLEHENFKDYKTELQEIIQRNPEEKLSYVLIDENGPDHNKSFTVEVHLNSNVIGTGIGNSKKTAEQAAARQALELMGIQL